jgi:ABC-2 type transport system permease protein
VSTSPAAVALSSAKAVSLARMIAAYARFDLRRILRNRRYLAISVAFPVLFYLFETGALGTNRFKDLSINGIPWITYSMVSMGVFGAVQATLMWSRIVATERSRGWIRQLRVSPLPPLAYVSTKLLVSLLTTVPAIALVLVAGAAANGVELSAPIWVELLIGLTLGALPLAAYGLLLGYVFDADSVQGAYAISSFLFAILGGVIAPVTTFPPLFRSITDVLPVYHLANIGWRAVAGQAPDPVDLLVLLAYTIAIGALVVWRYRVDEGRS